jgi:hypothetical protein
MDDRTLRTEVQELVAGQQFIPIDPRPYLATLACAEATRQRDMAQLANAGQDVVRAQRLASAGAGTSRNRDAMLAQQAARKATLSSDEAAIYEAQLNLSFTQISSPLVGRVGPRQVDVGGGGRDGGYCENEARVAASERKVGGLTMEMDLVQKTLRPLIANSNERSSIITGPQLVPSNGDAKQ